LLERKGHRTAMDETQINRYLGEGPRNRSNLRLYLGKCYYTWKRSLLWMKQSCSYAQYKKNDIRLPYLVATHKTPLIRQLQSVDMWLQQNKVNNLKLAVNRINSLIIAPGETFSFWYLIGKPTHKKGYLKGMVLCNGSFKPGIGGGLCQLSNLIYWMTIHSPLTVTERWRHNYDVFPDVDRTQPFGSGATVVYNYVDLQVTNATDSDYQLVLWLDEDFLQGEWRSQQAPLYTYQVYEKEHRITHEWWGGYMRHNKINRRVYNRKGQEIDDVTITENHAVMMYAPMLAWEMDRSRDFVVDKDGL